MESVNLGEPLRKYRVYIRELKSVKSKKEVLRSFMVYDFSGKSNIESLKNKLKSRFYNGRR